MAYLHELLDAFGAGLYLLFGAAHLDLWLRRRDRLGYLWLAAASGPVNHQLARVVTADIAAMVALAVAAAVHLWRRGIA